jgi:hypothetical protein
LAVPSDILVNTTTYSNNSIIMADNVKAGVLRETLAKEFRAREKWEKKYGKKYRKEVTAEATIIPGKHFTREYRDAPHNDSDSEDDDLSDEEEFDPTIPQSGLTGRFVGFYIPDKQSKRTYNTTVKEVETLKEHMHVAREPPKEDKTNHRKKDWLKNYFEDYSRQKLITKGSKPGGI